jgi:ribosome maturation factor RimP
MLLTERLEALIRPTVEGLGCELWGVEYHGGGQNGRLVIYIDREAGVDVGDCERVSRQVSALLDVEEPIPGAYRLEVSSPGLDRPLFTPVQFGRYVGRGVRVSLHDPLDGRSRWKGVIAGIEEGELVLRVDDEELILPFESIRKASLIPEY